MVLNKKPLSVCPFSFCSSAPMCLKFQPPCALAGAVMYLFKGEFGCVLYTGDFRWEATSERAQMGKKTLLEALNGDNIDVLYLDNTYCNPSFSFPPREVAAWQVLLQSLVIK